MPSPLPSPAELSRSIDVNAPPARVWDLVSDLPRMGRLSPENAGGSWLGGATGPSLGARFRGANRQGWRRWSTSVVVTACEPGSRFSFDVSSVGLKVARWSYDVVERPGGCMVTETWQDRRGRTMTFLGSLVTGVSDRPTSTGANLEQTLQALKTLAEAG